MNIYEYLVSPDISAYCEKIGHSFNPLEMAIIINISNKTLKEKHAAYREIIAEYPDMPIHKSLNFEAKESLHQFLLELISFEEAKLAEFYQTNEKIVYRYTVYEKNHGRLCRIDDEHLFPSVESILVDLREQWEGPEDDILGARIDRQRIGATQQISIEINEHGEVLDLLGIMEEFPDELRMIYFHLLVPFEKGDLVSVSEWTGDEPGVLL